MAKCERCYHNKVCINGANHKNAESCIHFKDKDQIVGLPCKMGDTVYFHKILCDGKGTVVVEKDIVRRFNINKFDTFAIISYSHALSCDDFGKSVFLTREEAEAVLEERENNDT